ncbi:DNA-binding LytR/AlgR family response regulator [Lewinella marina]|uniref:DNA-binding response regulator n=1 Tax=Neolewinella marina TaxID=438751 RepID=A0A2G0CDZ3_9BACT|nr:LytTR family DNA-binding domain-containing protein [Neolewinella marina]NJB87498.1 DNA-binding LytR/AlgR family response regulator [Neolewinella marina]PHK98196.1 DNA-binding response regulator [Neolewinella marina]
MSVLNCLIVDDEELARRLVRSYCERLPDLRVAGEAPNPVAAGSILRTTPVDLLFLDIQMPEMTGLDFLATLRQPPAVILTTAYSEYALEGYEFDVVDYLLKPFSFERFVRAVGKARDYRFPPDPGTGAPPPPGVQLVRADRKVYRIPHAEIFYIESMREYVAYHTPRGRTVALGSLRQLEENLPQNFLRVHKSFIVATDKVEALDGNQLQIGEARIPVGGSYREEVLRRLFPREEG